MRTVFFLFLLILPLAAEGAQERVEWCRAPQALAGRLIDVHLLSGERISGAWAAVTTDAVTITHTNGKSRTVARQQIRSVRASRRRVRGRVLGTVIGFYSTVAIGAASTGSAEALQSAWGPVAVAVAVGGYFAGRSLDRDAREITLLFTRGCD